MTLRTSPAPKVGVVHLGLGAFFRAHGAIYLADAMAASGGDWGVLGASLQSPRIRDALAPQDFAYTAVEAGPDGDRARVIDVLAGVLVAPESPAHLVAAMAAPEVRLVTLTVTEKGYCHDPATGRLNLAHPDIAHDLADPAPRSAPGFLVRALQARRQAGLPPFTILSCDNLPANGKLLRGIVIDLARRIDTGLADWIATHGRFPCSMVDRIVPAAQPGDPARAMALTGKPDAAPVIHEPFRQWVIEDDFVGGIRPDLARAGATLVTDVAPFEQMKLRMLNASHSALAYLGYLAGHETIAETIADPVFSAYARRLWAEVIPTLTPPPGADLPAYAKALEARYRNPAIRHRCWQIAMDGSQKLPQRLLSSLAVAVGPALCLAVAGWMRYVGGVDERGQRIDVRDPLAATLADLAERPDPVSALLSEQRIFPPDLARRLDAPLHHAHSRLLALGARAAAQEIAQ